MARLQWCRLHIDEVAEACGLSTDAKKEVEIAADFCEKYSAFADLPTRTLRPLIREKDKEVQAIAIIKCEERLNGKRGAGRGNTSKLTEKSVKKIVAEAELELRKEIMVSIKNEKELAKKNGSVIKEITQEEVDSILGATIELDDPQEQTKNEEEDIVYSINEVTEIRSENKNLIINTISRKEINIFFEVMKKIMFTEDTSKYKKRIDMMIENKTLLIVE